VDTKLLIFSAIIAIIAIFSQRELQRASKRRDPQ
jgi:hypothetical protein